MKWYSTEEIHVQIVTDEQDEKKYYLHENFVSVAIIYIIYFQMNLQWFYGMYINENNMPPKFKNNLFTKINKSFIYYNRTAVNLLRLNPFPHRSSDARHDFFYAQKQNNLSNQNNFLHRKELLK